MPILRRCVFADGDNKYLVVKSSSASSSVWLGLLYAGNCVNRTFYCDPNAVDNTGRNPSVTGYYRLIQPEKYGLNVSTNAYVDIASAISVGDISATNTTIDLSNIPSVTSVVSQVTPASTTTTRSNVYRAPANIINNNINITSASDYSDIENSLKNVNKINGTITSLTGYDEMVNNTIKAFNKYKLAFPDLHLGRAIPYVFFTRPDLNFFNVISSTNIQLNESVSEDPLIYGLYKTDKPLLLSLTKALSSAHSFNPFLSNMALSFDVSDESIETLSTGDTYTGWRVKYGRHNIQYKSSGTFNVSYLDTNKIQVYKIHKAWLEYISKVYRGEIESKSIYIRDRRLDYACSVYYILCEPDGETILYWAKYVGVFPSTAPTGTFSWNKGSVITNPESSITYEYSWKSDMELPILSDFNYNAGISTSDATENVASSPSYYNNLVGGGYTFANNPFIKISTNSDGTYVFKLKFKK